MISTAWAQTSGGSAFGGFEVLLPMVLVFVVFYFLLIRPQQRKVKEHQAKLSSIAKGDEVLTGGGFYGKVVKADGDDLWIRLGDGMEVRVLRSTVMDKLSKGTVKGLEKKSGSTKLQVNKKKGQKTEDGDNSEKTKKESPKKKATVKKAVAKKLPEEKTGESEKNKTD